MSPRPHGAVGAHWPRQDGGGRTACACTARRGYSPRRAAPAARPPGRPGAWRPRTGAGKPSPSAAALKRSAAPGRKSPACRPWASEGRPRCGRGGASGCPPHRATSEVLAVAYPFLAEQGLGSEGVLIGQDAWSGTAFCYDPWELYRRGVLTNPNMFLAGQIGRGKSALAKSFASRCSRVRPAGVRAR